MNGVDHKVTESTKQTVRDLYACGITQARIAERLEISETTLRKYYKEELDDNHENMISSLAKNLYQEALNGNENAREFWLKCRGRWSYHKQPEEEKKTTTETLLEKLIDKL